MEKLSNHRSGIKSRRPADVLSRFLYCADCGHTYTSYETKKTNRTNSYYKHQCTVRNNKNRQISQEKLYALIDRKIEQLKFSDQFGGRLQEAFDPCFAEHERNQNFKEDGIRFQIGVLKQSKRDLLKEDFQNFSRAEIEEAAGEIQTDINRRRNTGRTGSVRSAGNVRVK